MANILNIETSSTTCSVALAEDGAIKVGLESTEGMNHAEMLAPFVDKCMQYLKENSEKLDAVAVSAGPGSYTGLRIGYSLAKGLAFSLDIPLIALPTLKVLAVKAMFSRFDWEGDEIIIPMVDARRMEVYTAAYDFSLNQLSKEEPMILDENSYSEFMNRRKVIFVGDGSLKFKDLYKGDNSIWIEGTPPHARDMVALSEKFYRDGDFADIAYSTPRYLKEYQTTVAKSRLI